MKWELVPGFLHDLSFLLVPATKHAVFHLPSGRRSRNFILFGFALAGGLR